MNQSLSQLRSLFCSIFLISKINLSLSPKDFDWVNSELDVATRLVVIQNDGSNFCIYRGPVTQLV